MNLTLHGIIAGIFSTVALLPQIIKSWSTNQTKDLSFGMMWLMIGGAVLWFTYGLRKKDKPIIIANGVILALTISLLVLKIKYG